MNIFSRIRNRLSHAQIMALGFFMVIITPSKVNKPPIKAALRAITIVCSV